jgi:hypothetical protein
MGSGQQSIFGLGAERVERPGTGAATRGRSTSNRPKRLAKSVVSGPLEPVERVAEATLHAREFDAVGEGSPSPARISVDVDNRSSRSSRSTDTESHAEQVNEVERPELAEPVPPRSTEESHEICSLEVRHFADLPLPSTLTLDVPSVGTVLVSTSRARVERERRAGALVWAPIGFELAAYAVQEGRALPSDWASWCGRLRAPGWRLEDREALGGAAGVEDAWRAARRANPVREPRITIGRFLRLVGARLLEVVVEDAPSAAVAAEVVW